jgi:hypothetical protein
METPVEWLYDKISKSSTSELISNINNWFKQARDMERTENKQTALDYFILETGLHMNGHIDSVNKGLVSISSVYNKAKEIENKRFEQLKDFDVWKEWKNGNMPDL